MQKENQIVKLTDNMRLECDPGGVRLQSAASDLRVSSRPGDSECDQSDPQRGLLKNLQNLWYTTLYHRKELRRKPPIFTALNNS